MTQEKIGLEELNQAVATLTENGMSANQFKNVLNRLHRKYVTMVLNHPDESNPNAEEDSFDLYVIGQIAELIEKTQE